MKRSCSLSELKANERGIVFEAAELPAQHRQTVKEAMEQTDRARGDERDERNPSACTRASHKPSELGFRVSLAALTFESDVLPHSLDLCFCRFSFDGEESMQRLHGRGVCRGGGRSGGSGCSHDHSLHLSLRRPTRSSAHFILLLDVFLHVDFLLLLDSSLASTGSSGGGRSDSGGGRRLSSHLERHLHDRRRAWCSASRRLLHDLHAHGGGGWSRRRVGEWDGCCCGCCGCVCDVGSALRLEEG